MDWLTMGVLGVTSAATCVIGVAARGRSLRDLGCAAAGMSSCIALTLIFTLANLLVAALVVVAAGPLTGTPISLNILDSAVWPMLSLLQALTWHLWGRGPDR
jgi:hypothetical protein